MPFRAGSVPDARLEVRMRQDEGGMGHMGRASDMGITSELTCIVACSARTSNYTITRYRCYLSTGYAPTSPTAAYDGGAAANASVPDAWPGLIGGGGRNIDE